jgi:hypothetical protein
MIHAQSLLELYEKLGEPAKKMKPLQQLAAITKA